MKRLSPLRVSSEDLKRELNLIAHNLEERAKDFLINLPSPFIFTVVLPDGEKVSFLVSKEGIRQHDGVLQLKDRVEVGYADFKRLIEKPQRAVRYLFEGRLRVYGDVKALFKSLEGLL